jgi:hypothetical protein
VQATLEFLVRDCGLAWQAAVDVMRRVWLDGILLQYAGAGCERVPPERYVLSPERFEALRLRAKRACVSSLGSLRLVEFLLKNSGLVLRYMCV